MRSAGGCGFAGAEEFAGVATAGAENIEGVFASVFDGKEMSKSFPSLFPSGTARRKTSQIPLPRSSLQEQRAKAKPMGKALPKRSPTCFWQTPEGN